MYCIFSRDHVIDARETAHLKQFADAYPELTILRHSSSADYSVLVLLCQSADSYCVIEYSTDADKLFTSADLSAAKAQFLNFCFRNEYMDHTL
jgi:hypothetical protein